MLHDAEFYTDARNKGLIMLHDEEFYTDERSLMRVVAKAARVLKKGSYVSKVRVQRAVRKGIHVLKGVSPKVRRKREALAASAAAARASRAKLIRKHAARKKAQSSQASDLWM